MNKQTEALKMNTTQAIDFLYAVTMNYTLNSIDHDRFEKAVDVLAKALEQPQDDDLVTGTWIRYNDGDDNKRLALELDIAMNGIDGAAKSPALIDVLKQAVDYFHKQTAQEPVAWIEPITKSLLTNDDALNNPFCNLHYDWKPLYTHPAPSWQGLSDDEKLRLSAKANYLNLTSLLTIELCDAMLKEKNT